MGYLHEVDAWLEEQGVRDDEIKREIKSKILESYRNGRRDVMRRFAVILKEFTDDAPGQAKTEAKPVARRQYSKPRRPYKAHAKGRN